MNELFWARLTSILFLVVFAFKLIFGNRAFDWLDWLSGIAFAISIYYLKPLFVGCVRKLKSRR